MGLSSALSALRAGEQAFGSTSLNISNASTDGFKTEEAKFVTLLTNSASTKGFSSGGVQACAVRNASEQGLLKATGSAKDIAISGNGFFVVGKKGGLAAGTTNDFSFTRAGSFVEDKEGYLKNTAGYFLQGWRTDTDGVPTATDLNSLNQLETIRTNQIAGISAASTKVELKLNLPSQKPVNGTENTTVEIYNSLGEANTLSFTWEKTADNPLAVPRTIGWNVIVTVTNGTVTQGAAAGGAAYTIPIVFDGEGRPVSFNGTPQPPQIYITWNSAANPNVMDLSLGTVNTSDGISCRAGEYQRTFVNQDGRSAGKLTNVEVNEDGIVSAIFSNGQALKIYKIPMANFSSPHQLASKDGNVWGQTDSSGGFLLSAANSTGMGSIKSNSLEQSTVEISRELTKMMEISRFYSSNIKAIQADDEMFNDLKQLHR